jgi:hypothetical protein
MPILISRFISGLFGSLFSHLQTLNLKAIQDERQLNTLRRDIYTAQFSAMIFGPLISWLVTTYLDFSLASVLYWSLNQFHIVHHPVDFSRFPHACLGYLEPLPYPDEARRGG